MSHPSLLALLPEPRAGLRPAAPRCRGRAWGPGTHSPAAAPSPALPVPRATPAPVAALALGQLPRSQEQPGPRTSQRPSPGAKSSCFERSRWRVQGCCRQHGALGLLPAPRHQRGPAPRTTGARSPTGTKSPRSRRKEGSTQPWALCGTPSELPIPGDHGTPRWQRPEQPGPALEQPPPGLGLPPTLPSSAGSGDPSPAHGWGHGQDRRWLRDSLLLGWALLQRLCRAGQAQRGDWGAPKSQPRSPQRHFGVWEKSGSDPVPTKPVLPSLSCHRSPPARSLGAC